MPTIVLPDILTPVRDHLIADTELADLIGGRVYLTLPDPLVLPCIRIQRIGGQLSAQSNAEMISGPDRATISVHCWAETVHGADVLAATCRGALLEMPAVVVTPNISRVTETTAPQTIWDTTRTPDLPRSVLTVSITYR